MLSPQWQPVSYAAGIMKSIRGYAMANGERHGLAQAEVQAAPPPPDPTWSRAWQAIPRLGVPISLAGGGQAAVVGRDLATDSYASQTVPVMRSRVA